MRYADSLLTQGEVVVLRTRQHWLQLLKRARHGLLLWLVGIVLIGLVVWFNVAAGLVRDLMSWAAVIAFVAGLAIFLWAFWHWWAQDYMVTNRRLLKVTGVLNKQSADSSLEMINDVVLNQSMWGRLFNYGNLEIMTAAEEPGDVYHMLAGPVEFKKTMLTAKHTLETELRSGQPPTPPLRASEPPAPLATWPMPAAPAAAPVPPAPASAPPAAVDTAPATPPAPAPASASAEGATPPGAATEPSNAAAPTDESLEITQTLARLADLRDKGVITPLDYEQKKTELLGRL
jgi:Bacterial PH domain